MRIGVYPKCGASPPQQPVRSKWYTAQIVRSLDAHRANAPAALAVTAVTMRGSRQGSAGPSSSCPGGCSPLRAPRSRSSSGGPPGTPIPAKHRRSRCTTLGHGTCATTESEKHLGSEIPGRAPCQCASESMDGQERSSDAGLSDKRRDGLSLRWQLRRREVSSTESAR